MQRRNASGSEDFDDDDDDHDEYGYVFGTDEQTTEPEVPQQQPPQQPQQHLRHRRHHPLQHRNLPRFVFPTLADLSGLLNSSVGASFRDTHQVKDYRRRKHKKGEKTFSASDVTHAGFRGMIHERIGNILGVEPEAGPPEDILLEYDDEDFNMVALVPPLEVPPISTSQASPLAEIIGERQLAPPDDDLNNFILLNNTNDAKAWQTYSQISGESSIGSHSSILEEDDTYRRGIFVTLILLTLIILGNLVGGLMMLMRPDKVEHPYVCTTDNCQKMAQWLKSGLDESVHPCDDFYHFACGGYERKNPPYHFNASSSSTTGQHSSISSESPQNLLLYIEGIPMNFRENDKVGKFLKKVDTFPEDQLLNFYQTCIDWRRREERGVKPIFHLFGQIRIVVPQAGAYRKREFDIARVMGRIYRKTNVLFFVDLDGVVDNMILLKLRKPSQEVLHTPPDVYAKAMRKCWELVGREIYVEIDDHEIDTIVYLVMKFEAELNIILSKGAESVIFGFPTHFDEVVPPPQTYHSNFIPRRGTFEWEDLVSAIMGYTPDAYNEFQVFFNLWSSLYSKQDRYYILLLQNKLKDTPVYVIFRYFQWELMKLFAVDLNKEMQDIMLSIHRSSGQSVVERCFRSLFSNLHVLAAHRYKMLMEDPDSIDRNMTAIAEKVFQTYIEAVTHLDVPIALKASLLATSKTLRVVVEPVSNLVPYMNIYYKGLNCSYDHFGNVIQARSIKARNALLKAKNHPPFHMWLDSVYSLTEVTETSLADAWSVIRYMHVPFGAMQAPFMGNDLPILNYAGFAHYMVSYFLMKFALDDLFQVYELNMRIREPHDEVQVIKDFQTTFVEIMECVIETQSGLHLRAYPDLKINMDVRATRMKMLARNFALELTMLVIDKIMANTNTSVLGASPMEEIRRAHERITEVFPQYQMLPGLEHYTPKQLVFMSIARQTCQTLTRATAEYRMQYGPLLKEIVVKGSFRNTEVFADVWKCPNKTFMNPPRKCPFLLRKMISDDANFEMEGENPPVMVEQAPDASSPGSVSTEGPVVGDVEGLDD